MTIARPSSKELDTQSCWDAVYRRDPSHDGQFVFAVSTTGIYCRPSCSSRRANRENVSFFSTWPEAEKAGYRPCKRCEPQRQNGNTLSDSIIQACETLQAAETEPTLTELANAAGMSSSHFQRIFKTEIGLSPKQYAIALRKQRLRDALPHAQSITAAIYDAGYKSSSRAYADQAIRQISSAISYATAQTSLGPILLAASEQGICFLEFGDQEELLAKLHKSFPKATISHVQKKLTDHINTVIATIDGHNPKSILPIDIQGTAFQERVWRVLMDIPIGKTETYASIAQKIDQPKAARAVANACAQNRVAVLIPCHRVIHSDGRIDGYRWGNSRKRALLSIER